jgi:hypothetical protein
MRREPKSTLEARLLCRRWKQDTACNLQPSRPAQCNNTVRKLVQHFALRSLPQTPWPPGCQDGGGVVQEAGCSSQQHRIHLVVGGPSPAPHHLCELQQIRITYLSVSVLANVCIRRRREQARCQDDSSTSVRKNSSETLLHIRGALIRALASSHRAGAAVRWPAAQVWLPGRAQQSWHQTLPPLHVQQKRQRQETADWLQCSVRLRAVLDSFPQIVCSVGADAMMLLTGCTVGVTGLRGVVNACQR